MNRPWPQPGPRTPSSDWRRRRRRERPRSADQPALSALGLGAAKTETLHLSSAPAFGLTARPGRTSISDIPSCDCPASSQKGAAPLTEISAAWRPGMAEAPTRRTWPAWIGAAAPTTGASNRDLRPGERQRVTAILIGSGAAADFGGAQKPAMGRRRKPGGRQGPPAERGGGRQRDKDQGPAHAPARAQISRPSNTARTSPLGVRVSSAVSRNSGARCSAIEPTKPVSAESGPTRIRRKSPSPR